MQAGKDAQRAADEAAASGHGRLMALQQKQEAVAADMQSALMGQERWRAQWEAEKQDLQHELADLQHNIQVKCVSLGQWYASCIRHSMSLAGKLSNVSLGQWYAWRTRYSMSLAGRLSIKT